MKRNRDVPWGEGSGKQETISRVRRERLEVAKCGFEESMIRPRHPKFDEYWEKNRGMIWYYAGKLKRIFIRAGYERDDFLGFLTLRFNYVMYHHDPAKGPLINLFKRGLVLLTIHFFLRNENEYWHGRSFFSSNPEKDIRSSYATRELLESHYLFYRIPGQIENTWTMQIIDLFPDQFAAWCFLTANIPDRAHDLLLWKFRDGLSYSHLAELLGLSNEGARQMYMSTMKSIRNRLKKLEMARSLFFDTPENFPSLE